MYTHIHIYIFFLYVYVYICLASVALYYMLSSFSGFPFSIFQCLNTLFWRFLSSISSPSNSVLQFNSLLISIFCFVSLTVSICSSIIYSFEYIYSYSRALTFYVGSWPEWCGGCGQETYPIHTIRDKTMYTKKN